MHGLDGVVANFLHLNACMQRHAWLKNYRMPVPYRYPSGIGLAISSGGNVQHAYSQSPTLPILCLLAIVSVFGNETCSGWIEYIRHS